MGMYLICLSTSTNGSSIVSDIQNCQAGFEIAITYGMPQPPLSGPGGAISFWPGALVGTSGGYDWLFQPLLTQGEFSASGWKAAPAVWIQNPDGSTAAQLGGRMESLPRAARRLFRDRATSWKAASAMTRQPETGSRA